MGHGKFVLCMWSVHSMGHGKFVLCVRSVHSMTHGHKLWCTLHGSWEICTFNRECTPHDPWRINFPRPMECTLVYTPWPMDTNLSVHSMGHGEFVLCIWSVHSMTHGQFVLWIGGVQCMPHGKLIFHDPWSVHWCSLPWVMECTVCTLHGSWEIHNLGGCGMTHEMWENNTP